MSGVAAVHPAGGEPKHDGGAEAETAVQRQNRQNPAHGGNDAESGCTAVTAMPAGAGRYL